MSKIKGFIIFIVICTSFLAFTACSNDKIQTYSDKRFNFSVEFPKNWSSKTMKSRDATATQEGSPDGGIDIYVEGEINDLISVIGQNGHIGISLPDYEKAEFVTRSGLEGMLYSKTTVKGKEMYLAFNEGFHYVHINVSSDCFKRNEKKITDILKSINIVSTSK